MPEGRVIPFKRDTKPGLFFQIQSKQFFSGGAAWIASHRDRDGHKVKEALEGKSYAPAGFIKTK